MKERAKRRRGIDYNKEVAFEKKPAMGFFDTGAEQDRTKEIGQEFRPTTLEDMEGRRRKVCNSSIPLSRPTYRAGCSVHQLHDRLQLSGFHARSSKRRKTACRCLPPSCCAVHC